MLRRRLGKSDSGVQKPRYHLNKALVKDLLFFSQWQYDCLDYDPFHPMLVHLGKGLPKEDALWLSTLYMAFYNIGSAWVAFKNVDRLKPLPDWVARLPVGVQRRNLRGGQVAKHLVSFSALAKQHGSIEAYLTAGFGHLAAGNWEILKENVGRSWGNGRWSVYTTSELYQKVNKLHVYPLEIGNQGSTGPRSGLARFWGIAEPQKESVETLDGLADKLWLFMHARLKTSIPYLPKGHYDYGMLESQLCDFNSLCKGRYYVGRDIDRDQERIRAAAQTLTLLGKKISLEDVWDARDAVFERKYLGEFNGWEGRTEQANTYYVRTGQIADHMTIRKESRAGLFF